MGVSLYAVLISYAETDKLKRLNRIRLDSFRFLLFMICHFACYLLFVVIMIFLFSTRKPIPPLLSRIYSTSDSSA